MNPHMVIIYKFCKKEIFIQLTGEPREHHIGEVRPKKFDISKFHKRQNDRRGRYTLPHL